MSETLTARGYDEPSIRQLVIFLQNRVGELGDMLRRLEKEGVVVHAICVADSVDYAVIRMVAEDYEAARRILREMDLPVKMNEVLGVEMVEGEQSLLGVCRALIRGEINIHYVYSMLTRPRDKSVVLVHVDEVGTAIEVLRRDGYALLDDQDLLGSV